MGQLGEPPGTGARYRERKRWVLLEADTRAVSGVEETVMSRRQAVGCRLLISDGEPPRPPVIGLSVVSRLESPASSLRELETLEPEPKVGQTNSLGG